MKTLPLPKRAQILAMLVEASSMRSASRVVGVSINTVAKLLKDAGEAAEAFHDRTVRTLQTKQLQCDELWAFCYAKARTVKLMPEEKVIPGAGDIWTFTGLDRDSKLMVSWYCGDRDTRTARSFLTDTASRIESGVQVSTDGWAGYKELISEIFPLETSYGQVQKVYTNSPDKGPARRYSPGVCCSSKRETIFGNTDHAKISTSHVERQNLNIRMGNRRFTRLTNAFSKRIEAHADMLAVYFFHYNFCRNHKTLGMTPAQAAHLTDERLSMEDLVKITDAHHRPKPSFTVRPEKDGGSFYVLMNPNAYAPKTSIRGFETETAANEWIANESDPWFAKLVASRV